MLAGSTVASRVGQNSVREVVPFAWVTMGLTENIADPVAHQGKTKYSS